MNPDLINSVAEELNLNPDALEELLTQTKQKYDFLCSCRTYKSKERREHLESLETTIRKLIRLLHDRVPDLASQPVTLLADLDAMAHEASSRQGEKIRQNNRGLALDYLVKSLTLIYIRAKAEVPTCWQSPEDDQLYGTFLPWLKALLPLFDITPSDKTLQELGFRFRRLRSSRWDTLAAHIRNR